ncbi:MAG: SRPBCC family protein [Cryobacterium sp.]|nr:SRPBCC family protein [Oligoflexia bacterium]
MLEAGSWIPSPLSEVFPFFSVETNLERLTPSFMNFRVVGKSTTEIQEGTLIDYRLRVRGVPMKWRTRIEEWNPGNSFVDTQLKGPYALWHHTHRFESLNGGTWMTDRVRFKLPLGRLGKAVAGWFVKREVLSIFTFRGEAVRQFLG